MNIMVKRFFQAAGTLAVALVVLAGCDSADPASADASQGAQQTATETAQRGPGAITGPSPINPGCAPSYRYELEPNVSIGRPGTWTLTAGTGTGAIVATGQYAGTNVRWADVDPYTAGTITLTWTSGTVTYSKVITVSPFGCSEG